MALNDVFRVTFAWESFAERCGISLDYRDETGQTDADAAQDLLSVANPIGSTEIAACLANGCTLSSCYVRNINRPAMPARFQYVNVFGTAGADDPMPFTKALVVSLKGTDPALVRQGRCYISGMQKSDVTSGVFADTFLNGPVLTLRNKLDDVLAGGGGNWQPVITRTVFAGVPGTPVGYPITAVSATNIVYSQRPRQGRLRGVIT